MQTVETGIAAPSIALPVGRQVWLVLGCAIGIACGFAGLYFSTMAIFLKPMAASLGWTRGDISAAALISMLGLAIGAPLQGLVMDRWGARRVIGFSVVSLAVALLSFSWISTNPLMLGAISLAMGVLTAATGPNGYLSVLPRWFDRRLGLALSCAMVGTGVGALIMPKVAQSLIQSEGWRAAYRVLSLISLAGGGVACWFLRTGELGMSVGSGKDDAGAAGGEGVSLPMAIGERQFWLITAVMFIGGASGLGVSVHLVASLDDRGFGAAQAASAAALSGIGVMLGRLVAGALLDLVGAPLLGAVTYLLGAAGVLLVMMYFLQSFPLLALGALLVGLAVGAEGDFLAFAVRRYFGRKSFASIYGCLFSAYCIGGAAGPVLFGMGFDRLGSYRIPMDAAIAGFVFNIILVSRLGRYRFMVAPTRGGESGDVGAEVLDHFRKAADGRPAASAQGDDQQLVVDSRNQRTVLDVVQPGTPHPARD